MPSSTAAIALVMVEPPCPHCVGNRVWVFGDFHDESALKDAKLIFDRIEQSRRQPQPDRESLTIL